MSEKRKINVAHQFEGNVQKEGEKEKGADVCWRIGDSDMLNGKGLARVSVWFNDATTTTAAKPKVQHPVFESEMEAICQRFLRS